MALSTSKQFKSGILSVAIARTCSSAQRAVPGVPSGLCVGHGRKLGQPSVEVPFDIQRECRCLTLPLFIETPVGAPGLWQESWTDAQFPRPARTFRRWGRSFISHQGLPTDLGARPAGIPGALQVSPSRLRNRFPVQIQRKIFPIFLRILAVIYRYLHFK